jgi:protein-S-isoprenylcysteine O-methyltransferase Ste14
MVTYLPIAILLINLCSYLFDLILLSNKNLQDHFLKLPLLIQELVPFLIVGPLFISQPIPQNRFNISSYISLPMGTLLFVFGWIFMIPALCKFRTIPSLRKKSNLITSGIFRVVRHPIYTGTLMAVLGWTILWKSLISLLYFPVLFLLCYLVVVFEERGLLEEYGDEYADYKKNTAKRLIPFVV